MTARFVLRTFIIALAFVGATWIAWWGVPVAAALFGSMTARDSRGPIVAGVGAVVAWSAILVWDAWVGPVGTVAATLGGVLQVHAVVIYLLTIVFAGLLALSAAIVARALTSALTIAVSSARNRS